MKVAILGGGVIGVTSAHYLSKAGHEVVLVDRQPGPALETSFANAGEVSFGYSSPWAGPGIPVKAIKWLIMRHGPLVVRPILDPLMWIWIARMLRNCTSARYRLNKSRMVAIAEYARTCIAELRAETGIAYDEATKGTLQLFRTQAQLDHTASDIEVLKQYAIAYEVLDPAGCIAAEPALAAVKGKFVGGLRLPGDETGDCHIFTNRLAEICRARGVDFRFDTTIDGISVDGGKVTGISTSAGPLKADAYVVALGSHAPKLLRTVGLSVPIYPVKGYSLTFAVSDPAAAPVLDDHGRELQGRDHAAWRPHPRGRHGRTVGFRHDALSGTACHARAFGHRPVPRRRRCGKRHILVGPAPDDAGRPAGRRPDEDRQPFHQWRARNARLDDVVRLGPLPRRRDLGPEAGDRSRTAQSGTLSGTGLTPEPRSRNRGGNDVENRMLAGQTALVTGAGAVSAGPSPNGWLHWDATSSCTGCARTGRPNTAAARR